MDEKVIIYLKEIGRLGGQATARKYGTKQMKKWGNKGGRPRKSDKNKANSLLQSY